MRLGVELDMPLPPLRDAILRGAAGGLDRALARAVPAVLRRVRGLCDRLIAGGEGARSLISGRLLGDLGLTAPDERVAAVLRAVRDSVKVWAVPARVSGGTLRAALEWLTIGGDRILVYNYHVASDGLTASELAASRSKVAIMRSGGSWRVPPEFAGFPGDNWLTRPFDGPAVVEEFARIFEVSIREVS
jgi:hypothetical protein